MAMEYGNGGGLSVTMDGPFGGSGASGAKLVTISVPVANWKGGESPFSQVVTVDGVTVSSKLDVQLSEEQITHFKNNIIAFQAVNNTGIITLYAYGSMPDIDMEIQATISEVMGEGVIQGDIFTTTNPQADYGQTDPSKADYIKNKPDAAIAKAQTTADAALARSGGDMTGYMTVLEPTAEKHPVPRGFMEKHVETYVGTKYMAAQASLTADKWSAEAPYTQTIEVDGILSTDRPHIGLIPNEDVEMALVQEENWGYVSRGVTGDGSITFTCYEDKPEVNLPLQIEVNR